MNDQKKKEQLKKEQEREKRLAEALRINLKKRKAAQKTQQDATPDKNGPSAS